MTTRTLAMFFALAISGCLQSFDDMDKKNLCDENALCTEKFTCVCLNEKKICVESNELNDEMLHADKDTVCKAVCTNCFDAGPDAEADAEVGPEADAEVGTPDVDSGGGKDVSPDSEPDTTPDTGADIPCIPSTEICDGKDNDCDNQTDEGFDNLNQVCNVGKGECFAEGVYVCSADGNTTTCNAVAGQAIPEECDELDNDCDGTIDEELVGCCDQNDVQECGNDVGECQKGQMTCQEDGSWGQCENAVDPSADLCDLLDNDCDGNTDEDFVNLESACQIGQGLCISRGVYVCSDDKLSATCNAQTIQPTEEACDQQDNDCDGATDEDLVGCCNANDQVVCGSNVGECQKGRKTCSQDGVWSECTDEVKPTAELCDAKDNNCDGNTDEAYVNLGAECQIGVGACLSLGQLVCGIDQQSTFCNAVAGLSHDELCDNKDNDCDGATDEALTQECGNDVGECQKGVQSCFAGVWLACEGEVQSSNEICDSLDNNCDHNTDEGFNTRNFCSNGVGECYAEGVIACVNDQTSSCNAIANPSTDEICDGLDNDCDDSTDEDLEGCCEPRDLSYCGIDTGECEKGTSTCQANRSWGWCEGATGPSDEICDGLDNNCNSETDENLIGCCSPGVSRNCGTDVGECQIGTQICWESREWGECQNQITSVAEICDGLDNDCDGTADNGFDLLVDPLNCGQCNRVCGNQGTSSSRCVAGQCVLQCNRFRFDVNANPTDGCECTVTNCGVEICDQVDNDCDGAVDEDCRSLVMYLSFDNHFNDGSPNANNAVNHGATFTADAVCGQAASFDGVDDYAEVADSVSMDSIANEFTYFVSVKVRTYETGDMIFSRNRMPGLGILSTDDGFKWTFYLSQERFAQMVNVNANQLYAFAAKYQNGNFTVYNDGVPIWNGPYVNIIGNAMLLGAQNVGGQKSDMTIDEFSFFNKALSDAEIQHYFEIMRR